MKEKVILTDCDGVLLDWEYGFDTFMREMGYNAFNYSTYKMDEKYGIDKVNAKKYISLFNKSACMRFLSPFRDSVKYIKKLHEEHGYVFHVITSQTDNIFAKKLREQNLRAVFGETFMEKLVILDCGADKDATLFDYRNTGCYWIEDKPTNADVGIQLGLNSILMSHNHNADYKGRAVRVGNWNDIYNIVVNI